MGGTVNMGGKVLYMVIHLYNSCTQYSTVSAAKPTHSVDTIIASKSQQKEHVCLAG